jgi:hypothetical protein
VGDHQGERFDAKLAKAIGIDRLARTIERAVLALIKDETATNSAKVNLVGGVCTLLIAAIVILGSWFNEKISIAGMVIVAAYWLVCGSMAREASRVGGGRRRGKG